MTEPIPEKIGAGLLFICKPAGGDHPQILLLKRSMESGNPGTLGLPGGNQDATDADLLETAVREATEEMSVVPIHTVKGAVLTKRGKRQQKHYTVYLAEISEETKAAWTPQLNEEHSEYMWVPLQAAALRQDLHPVVKLLFGDSQNRRAVYSAAGLA